ncbi:GNAT family N-acetyltransferase [Bacillus cereus]|uniref:GNAT family N-acetyltransferase n=1 Tax=Bacillus cereus group TaxID=86661 RepID=UPI000BECA9C7|nr:GNAT family N-acetyltransferase [Bacillus cereus]PDZ05573.1 GNAT family N-acetyltransferase [Bacillus cereus]PEC56803.1 GNAT family N-acetyltransferase [Bacillus cereus]PFE44990.1 GNAT family N-acetyltransferase [Bacillus cereus]PFN15159.1 GNAT family N-acetyltransferase [Bacillus cereus]PFS81456.1 GNAT family N-acetyltransferase [Bacillus cereus]
MEIIQLLKNDDLFNKAIDVFWKEWGEEGGRAFYKDCMTNALTDPNNIPSFYIVKIDNEIIGTYALIRNDLNSRQDLSPWLACLFVDEKFRGNSIGEKLLNHGLLEAAKRGYHFLYLTSDLNGYYEKYGWEKIGVAYGPSGGCIPLFKKSTAL